MWIWHQKAAAGMIPILLACLKVLWSPFDLFSGDKNKAVDEKAATATDDHKDFWLPTAYAAFVVGFLFTLVWAVLVARGIWRVVNWIL